jgi:hypothetical protein
LWVNWEYVRDLFIMPNGLCEEGTKEAANTYFANKSCYPYQMYINWNPSDEGNILYNDEKFLTLLYRWHGEEFVGAVNPPNPSIIYDFIEGSEKLVLVVDCENSDPYNLCATLKSFDEEYLRKIAKIILIDDVHAAVAWQILEKFTSVPVERKLTKRIREGKSIVDSTLTVMTLKEHYKNNVDSFVIVASDSDYWPLIDDTPDARFLVMLEHGKAGLGLRNALRDAGIYYCYIDDFYSGNSDDIKITVLIMEARRYINQNMHINVNDMMDTAYRSSRIEMPDAEKKQFYDKYIKPMYLEMDADGNLTIQIKKK